MAELATIARPYAEALFQVVKADAAKAAEWLDDLAVVAADPGLLQYAHDPKVTHAQVLDLIAQVGPKSLPAAAVNLLSILVDNGRLAVLPEIAHHFHVLVDAMSGVRQAMVYSAFPIEGAALDDLTKVIEKRFGSNSVCVWPSSPSSLGAYEWWSATRCSTLRSKPVWNK